MTTSILDAMPGPAMALACWILGRGLARRAGLPYRGVEGLAYAVGLGTGVGSLLLLGLFATLASQFSNRSAWILVLFTFGAMGQALVGRRAQAPGPRPPDPARDHFAAAPLLLGVLLLAASLAPETGWDALAYHLPVAERIRLHGLAPLVGHLDGELRLGFDLLYAPMAALHSVQAVARGPAFLHAACGVALGLAVFAEARRRAGSIAAAAVACLFLVSPAVADLAGTAYVDLAVGLHAFLALACVARALRGDVGRNVLAAGLFAGFAANDKLSAATVVPVVALALLLGAGVRRGVRPALVAGLVGVGVTLPWVARAWADTGNPFFPFFLDRFGSGWAEPSAVRATTSYVLGQTGLSRTPWLPLTGTWHALFDPAFGFQAPAWVIALLPAAWTTPTTPERRGLLVGGLGLALAWGFVVPQVRFGFAAWGWGAVAAAVGAARLAAGRRALAVGLAAAAVLCFGLDAKAAWRTGERLLSLRSESAALSWLRRERPEVDGVREASTRVLGRVGVVGAPAGLVPPVFGRDPAVSMEPMRNGVLDPTTERDPEALRASCRRLGLGAVVFPVHHDVPTAWRSATLAWRDAGLGTLLGEPTPGPDGLEPKRDSYWLTFRFAPSR